MPASTATDEHFVLVEDAQADPAGFRERAATLLEDCGDGDRARAQVRWALGVALRELGELAGARQELDAAVGLASSGEVPRLEALIRSSLATVLLSLGHTELALQETELAAETLDGSDAARNDMQRGVILQRLGRQDDAVRTYDLVQPRLRATGDRAAESRLLSNRGVLHAYAGRLANARADLERSVELARDIGATRGVALGLQNLGFVAGREGDLPGSLALLEQADELLRELGDSTALAVLDVDRAEVLADAGLLEEAIERAEAAVRALAQDHLNAAEAELLLARLCLMVGERDRAASLANQVRERFRRGDRAGWELHARYVALAATTGSIDVPAADRLADDLEAGGWATEARDARLVAARQARADGDTDTARRILDQVRGTTRNMPALARAQHWYATALVRLDAGDRSGARRAVTAGLRTLDRSRLVFASAEMRAHAAGNTTDLVRLAIRLALADGRPAEVLRALDRVRATDIGVPRLPPADRQLADDLAELRRLDRMERDAARAGDDPGAAVRERGRIERRIRDRARALTHRAGDAASLQLDVPALRRRLAGRTLVAYFHLDGDLHAVTVERQVTRHHRLAPVEEVRATVDHLCAAVRRLAHGGGSPGLLAATEASLARSSQELAELLGLDRVDADGLVVVPTAVLNGLPWAALAAFIGQVPAVSPSAGAWLSAETEAPAALDRTHGVGRAGRRGGGSTLLVAGPDLPGAAEEVAALAEADPAAEVLTGDGANVSAVLAAMQSVDTAHLAAHGTFRSDNPMFSSLSLADGLLTVYELEGLRHLPSLVVLSSCDAATTTTLRGDAVLGLSSVLLRLGVRCVVAPVMEIPDETAGALMAELHDRIARGDTPQRALTSAIVDVADQSPGARAVRAAFVVVGASSLPRR